MKGYRKKLLCSLAFIAVCASAVIAQEPPLKSIIYRLSMSRPVSHLFEVSILIELPDEWKDKPLQLQMSKWSPGRYGVFDFAKNVQEVRAVTSERVHNKKKAGARKKNNQHTAPTRDTL